MGAAAAGAGTALGPMLAQLAAPKPNAFNGGSAPQHMMDEYVDDFRNLYGSMKGQRDQGVNLPDAVIPSSPTYSGGVLPFPIGNLHSQGLPGMGIKGVGSTGDAKSDPGPILNYPTRPFPSPSPSPTPDPSDGSPSPNAPDPGRNRFHPLAVNRVSPPNSAQPGSSNEDAQAALRALGMKMGF